MRPGPEPSTDCRGVIRGGDGCHLQALTPRGDARPAFLSRKQVLGGIFRFESDSRDLMELVEAAYGGLPPQTLLAGGSDFRIDLRLSPRNTRRYPNGPPAPRISSKRGGVFAIIDDANLVVIEPAGRCARVMASEDMLQHAYHLRYELIEFAVFVLATRGVGLVPLHAACIGQDGRGLLLLGDSGSGKSTLALHCLLQGLDLLSEDAVFVRTAGLRAVGVPNYLHLRADALRYVGDDAARRWISQAPVVRRRSGVEKFEVDLRKGHGRPAGTPLELIGAVFVSARSASRHDEMLVPLREHEFSGLLKAGQPNASSQPGWECFLRQLLDRGGHGLRRGPHPDDSVDALRQLLA